MAAMLFHQRFWGPIAADDVTVTVRRLQRRRVAPGSRYRTATGMLEVTLLRIVEAAADELTDEEHVEIDRGRRPRARGVQRRCPQAEEPRPADEPGRRLPTVATGAGLPAPGRMHDANRYFDRIVQSAMDHGCLPPGLARQRITDPFDAASVPALPFRAHRIAPSV